MSKQASPANLSDLMLFATEVGNQDLEGLVQEAQRKSFEEGKTAIPFQAVAKFLLHFLRKIFQEATAKGATPAWSENDFVQMTVQKIIEEDAIRPKTERMFEEGLKIKLGLAAMSVFRQSAAALSQASEAAQSPKDKALFDADQVKAIDIYLKRIQDEKKRSRDSALAGTVRVLSKEELSKYESVALTSEQARIFNKEKDSKALRKKI